MAYIYKIVNDINSKIYIGQTSLSIEQRFKTHCSDRTKRGFEKRPLYDAMNKYGIEHFHIELIEETDEPNEREVYWISFYDSYHNGYNATKGGEGTKILDYEAIKTFYLKTKSVKETAKEFNSDKGHISSILKSLGISQEEIQTNGRKSIEKRVEQYDKSGKYIQTFESVSEAGKSIWDGKSDFKGMKSHISQTCRGKRKTAYGYIWRHEKED